MSYPKENIITETSHFDVFISYSRKDSDFVKKIVDKLEESGLTVWFDQNNIDVGDQFKRHITEGLSKSALMLFIASSSSNNNSSWTSKEIGFANYKRIPIIPVRIDESQYSDDVLFDLVNIDHIFLTNDNFDEGMSLIVKSINQKINKTDCGINIGDKSKIDCSRDTVESKAYFKRLLPITIAVLLVAGLCILFLWRNKTDEEKQEISIEQIKLSGEKSQKKDPIVENFDSIDPITLPIPKPDPAPAPPVIDLDAQYAKATTISDFVALANKKYIKAYAPLAELYLKEREWDKAYLYAKKAIVCKSNTELANSVLESLEISGYRPTENNN